ncbi:RNA-directed DNA polymerase from mobile element jockey [Eumeta japonica]|uniref:RNA-directed DNA polymerase from mobile element jockey n=1 Tax=Eumeta variegata TaxID=151549 RepID=A0A4C1ZI79_EUMVA|nr:RNA-directed DNA polymerase from mobile element jockey [Eumeta japonica]
MLRLLEVYKYLIDTKVKFHTYALEEERKLKAVIRGIPADFETDDIKSDFLEQGFPVQSVHRLCRRDGSPLWLVLAVLPKIDEAKLIFGNLSKVAVCQALGSKLCVIGEAQANATAASGNARALANQVKSLNVLIVANYRGCPKAPKFSPPKQYKRRENNRPSRAPEGLLQNDENFPELKAKPSRSATAAFRSAPAPPSNPWGRNQPSRAAHEPPRESARRAPPSRPATAAVCPSSFGDDIQTVMTVLRAVSSTEISQFARDIRACRNMDEKLLVLVRYHHLMSNVLELTKCMSEYNIDIALIQETFLKPNMPKACAIAGYVQVRTDRTHGRKGGTALYYKRSLHCCPLDIPPLTNMEATGCRLAMTDHSVLVIVSVYLSPRRRTASISLSYKKHIIPNKPKACSIAGYVQLRANRTYSRDAVILFGDLNSKSTRWGSPVNNYNGNKLNRLEDRREFDFEIVTPSAATHVPNNDRHRPSVLDIAITKGVALNLNRIETLHDLTSDHRPVLLKMGPPDGGRPISTTIKITDWKKVSTALEKIDTPPLNNIPDVIRTTDEIDSAIGALTSHIKTVVERCEREVPASSDRRKFPPEILELIRAKNAALRRASAYPTPEYRSRARAPTRSESSRPGIPK